MVGVDVARVLAFAYPAAVSLVDYVVADDGSGPAIVRWAPALGTQPTPAELAALELSAPYLAWIAPAAVVARDAALHPERTTVRTQAAAAIVDLEAFLALAAPTQAQTLAVVKRLCQIQVAVIKRLVQLD